MPIIPHVMTSSFLPVSHIPTIAYTGFGFAVIFLLVILLVYAGSRIAGRY